MHRRKTTGKVRPHELFRVSDQLKYLEEQQLKRFEDAFRRWKDAAKRADGKRSRERLWLVFSLLKATGARLGEALSLNDAAAFDPESSCVRLGSRGKTREAPLPEELFAEIMRALESPMGCGLRGRFFHVDPGYFRRVCYARGEECGLPKALACPKALRNTRAVEMLRAGVPITVVKDVLGQSSLNLAAGFQQFSEADAVTIVRAEQRAMRKQTSARNAFVGHVVSVRRDAVMAEVAMETRTGLRINAVITRGSLDSLRIAEGTPVAATIKAPLVNVLACEHTPAGSARNRLRATIVRVSASPVLCEVTGRLPDQSEICALVSAQSAEELGLRPGDEAEFWFKALSVVLNTVHL